MNMEALIPISMDIFTDGMVIPCDVYDTRGMSLILKKGRTMTALTMERLYQHNQHGDGLLVSVENYQMLVAQNIIHDELSKDNEFLIKKLKQTKLEKETGFAEIKDGVRELFSMSEQTKIIQHDKTRDVSAEVSHRLEVTEPDTIISLVNMLASVDEYLHRHSVNVSMLNGLIGRWMGFSREDVDLLVTIGLTHDCGKAMIPLDVLNAPRRLSRVEFEIIKMHSIHSFSLLADFPEAVRYSARGHHEKICGKGYTDGLARDKIPVMARITAVSDIYDAMVSRRVYKEPRSPFQIMVQLKELSGTDLDPVIVDVFTNYMPKELVNKPVLMSNGETCVIGGIDPDDLEYPYVWIGDKLLKTDKQWYCSSMEL